MAAYLAFIRLNLRLAFRERSVLFFNYVFPLIFFFAFGQFMGSGNADAGAMLRVVPMVIVIGILGSGLFGAGIRAVAEREAGILRRYKVTPISPAPILVGSMVTGWLLYLPSAALVILLAHYAHGMPLPSRPLSLFLLISIACFSFRAIGLIVASVANSVAESNVLIQILYMPMLFLSGATVPVSSLPPSAQIVAQFLPASYLNTGVQHVMLRSQGIAANLESVAGLVATALIGTFIAMKLFRWEKEEKLPRRAKAWVLAVLAPFIAMGVYQSYSRNHIVEAKRLDREIRRNHTRLIRNALIFVGDGTVIPNGAVLIKDGRIAEVYRDTPPSAESLRADAVEAAGKTILPGLIDTHVHLGAPGGVPAGDKPFDWKDSMRRALESHLFCGVTAVRSVGDFSSAVLELRTESRTGAWLGAELFATGPLFTARGGHGTELFRSAPDFVREAADREFTRLPDSPDQARDMVRALKRDGVDGIKAVLDAGVPGMLFQRMDLGVLAAVGGEARAQGLPLAVHTGTAADIAAAVAAGARSIEHGARDAVPADVWATMAGGGVHLDPTLAVWEAVADMKARRADLLSRSLVQQVAPSPEFLKRTREMVERGGSWADKWEVDQGRHFANLAAAHKAGVPLVAGTDAGNPLVFHGPAIHRELQLWVQAGVPPSVALTAATANAARLLGIGHRAGLVKKGYDASLLIVDGNPLVDIAATERISSVIFQGERVDRQDLFEQR
jgi:imidazolonepropionase-like amidohydrolase/ABC-type multidrug transport system permease subunit